jgi:hypothetical protein
VDELPKLRTNVTSGILFTSDYEPKEKKDAGLLQDYAPSLRTLLYGFKKDGEKNKSMDTSINTSNGFPRQLK